MFNDAVQALIESVTKMVTQMLNNADYDRTYTGRVKSVKQIRKGLCTYLYTVTINGADHSIKSKLTYKVGDYASVLVPRNNWNDAKIVATGDDIVSDLEQRVAKLESMAQTSSVFLTDSDNN